MIKYLSIFCLWTGLFPYLTFYSFGTDIQPWNIIFILILVTIVYGFNYFNKFDKTVVPLLFLLILSISLSLISLDDSKSYIRSLFGYCTIALSPIAYCYIINRYPDKFIKYLKMTSFIWMGVALVQFLFDPTFMDFLLNRITSNSSRGVTSLSPEPTFYGIVGVFYILIFLVFGYNNHKKYIFLWLFQILIFAQSSMSILFILIFLFYLLIFKANIKIVLSMLLLVFYLISTLFVIDIREFSNIRMISLLITLYDNGLDVAKIDASVNARLSAIYFSIKGMFDNMLLPNGMSSYANYLESEVGKNDYFWWVSKTNRIMSYYGGIFYEMGIFGLIVPLAYTTIIFVSYKHRLREALVYVFFLNSILFSAIQMSFPLVGIYLASLLYRRKNENITRTQ